MSKNTKIEWADHTFNPWIGCTKVGPGCDNCYASAWDRRFAVSGHAMHWGPGQARSRTKTWGDPVRWNKQHEAFFAEHGRRQRVFCASLADVFDNKVPTEWLSDLFELIRRTPNLDWLLLTKRIGNWESRMQAVHDHLSARRPPTPKPRSVSDEESDAMNWVDAWIRNDVDPIPANVWLGATIVNQEEADRDIPKLIEVPAAKRFLSMEPLLGAVDIRKWLDPWTCADCEFHGSEYDCGPDGCTKCGESDAFPSSEVLCKSCGADDQAAKPSCPNCGGHRSFERDYGFKFDSERSLIDWVIVGGESGPNARPMHPDWARSLRDQCQEAGVPFLFKQWGEFLPAGANEADPAVLDVPDSRLFWSDGEKWDRFDGQRAGVDLVARVGKKAAGRLLDGQEWNGVPA